MKELLGLPLLRTCCRLSYTMYEHGQFMGYSDCRGDRWYQ